MSACTATGIVLLFGTGIVTLKVECPSQSWIACVSKSQFFVSYSVSKGYADIVARAIMMIWTCVERFAGAPIDYGQAGHINIVP